MKHRKRNDDSNLMQSTNTRLRNMRTDRNHSFIPLPHSNKPSPKRSWCKHFSKRLSNHSTVVVI